MRRAAIVTVVLLLGMDTASACHRFARWNYPWPQQCRVTALAPKSAFRLPRARISVSLAAPSPPRPHRPVAPTPEIALPSLTDIEWGQQLLDNELRGTLTLRALLRKEDQ